MNGYHNLVLVTLILAAAPSLVQLPLWVAAIAVAGGGMHYIQALRKGWAGKILSSVLLGAAAAGIWFSFDSLFSGKAVLSFFITVVFLKWAESKTRRDYLLLIFAAVILAAVGALYWESLLSLIHMLVVIFALTVSLISIHTDDVYTSVRFLLKRSSLLFILAIPLTLVLFLVFPRIPGPLWDIGIAFGLPVKALMNRGNGEFGKAKNLQPGGFHKYTENNDNVLVAEFEGPPPFLSRLYWRGPVYWEFDGENWLLPDGWDDRNKRLNSAINSKRKFDYVVRYKADPVRYTMRVMPNGGKSLYGLDIPAAGAPETYITSEFQLLSIRIIDDEEPRFPMVSYLEYGFGRNLGKEQRALALSWPDNTNPRLKALGEKIASEYPTSSEKELQVLKELAQAKDDFVFDTAHILPPGPDVLDRYFFDEKRGGAEYLAGSIAMLLRAAGVPSRLVSGYRGGTVIALTNFVIVKQAHAHAWVEAWDDDKGWHRVEAKDIILPPGKKAVAAKVEKKKAAAVELKQEEHTPLNFKEPHQQKKKKQQPPPTAPKKEENKWQMPDLSSWFGDLQKWVINYDPDKQVELLKGVGVKETNWLNMLIGAALGVVTLLLLYLAVAWWRTREVIDPLTASWQQFCKRMEKLGVSKMSGECPRNYLARICSERPELETGVEDIIGRYIAIRYQGDEAQDAVALFKRQVQRFVSIT